MTPPSDALHIPTLDVDDGLRVAATQPRSGLVRVRVIGEVDLLTVHRLDRVLADAVRSVGAESAAGRAEHPRVVCDLDDVTFLGASGLRTLVDRHDDACAREVRLEIVASHRRVRRPFLVTAFDRLVNLREAATDATDDAVAAV